MRSCSRELAVLAALGVFFSVSHASAQACHHGIVEDDTILWLTRVAGSASLPGPLPSDVSVVATIGGRLTPDGARIDALPHAPGILLTTRQSIDGDDVVLHPPLVTAAQRIVLSSRDGERISFAPALDGPVTRHVGYHASSGIDDRTRASLDAWCGPRERGVPTYVRDVGWDEVRGELVRARSRRGSLLWIGWIVLAFGAVGGGLAYRRLALRARVERAEAIIEERFRALEEEDGER